MNLQYQGSIATLENTLKTAGWQTVDTDVGLDWLKVLSSSTEMAQLPILPHSHQGRYESHQFIKPVTNQRLSLYLWPSGYLLQPDSKVIWLGEVSSQRVKRKMGLLSYPVTQQDHQWPLQQLNNDLSTSGLQMKQVAKGSVTLLRTAEKPDH